MQPIHLQGESLINQLLDVGLLSQQEIDLLLPDGEGSFFYMLWVFEFGFMFLVVGFLKYY